MAAEAHTVTLECKAVIAGTEVRIIFKKPGRQRYAKQPLAIIHCNDPDQAKRVEGRVNGDES